MKQDCGGVFTGNTTTKLFKIYDVSGNLPKPCSAEKDYLHKNRESDSTKYLKSAQNWQLSWNTCKGENMAAIYTLYVNTIKNTKFVIQVICICKIKMGISVEKCNAFFHNVCNVCNVQSIWKLKILLLKYIIFHLKF